MKTNIHGLNLDYIKILREVEEIEKQIFETGYAICDLPFFGYVGDSLEREREIYNTIDDKIKDLRYYLESVITRDADSCEDSDNVKKENY